MDELSNTYTFAMAKRDSKNSLAQYRQRRYDAISREYEQMINERGTNAISLLAAMFLLGLTAQATA
jgi:hypothetical protein